MRRILFFYFIITGLLFFTLSGTLLAEEVKLGFIYPMSGPVAQPGLDNKHVIELALDIINTTKYKHLNLPLAKSEGLPNLGGAKVTAVITDHQGKPDLGMSEAERLITQEKVVALVGSWQSSVTETASRVAERMQMPFLNPESSTPSLTERGFKWFFRVSPHDVTFSEAMFECLKELEKKRNVKLKTCALMYDDSLWGKEVSVIERNLAEKAGYKVVVDIPFRRQAISLNSEVQKLKLGKPDIFLPLAYTSDAILLARTSKQLDFNPPIIMANDAGMIDPAYPETLGKDSDGVCTRNEFSMDLAEKKPMIKEINDLFKKRSGRNLSGTSARCFVGVFVLCDAINRAGSTKPEAVREALKKTFFSAEQLIVPWRGVKFDEKGQNSLVDAIVVQFQGGQYYTVWPSHLATREMIYPIPKWSERK